MQLHLRTDLPRTQPAPDLFQQLLPVFSKHFRRHLITGRPVVNVWQEAVRLPDAALIILHLREEKGMELVFIKVAMREFLQELLHPILLQEILCVFSQRRCPDADDRFRRNGRYQSALELAVSGILQLKQFFCNLFRNRYHSLSLYRKAQSLSVDLCERRNKDLCLQLFHPRVEILLRDFHALLAWETFRVSLLPVISD